ncbi:MAG: PAC2 family protein [Dehalococcoidia bacterium]|nr:PAC2 family protein [Dehalococcoidia bacterium]
MESGKVIFYEWPGLRQPDMVVAYMGWPDAAQVATGAVSYLLNKLHAVKFADLNSDEFYDFTAARPSVNVQGGIVGQLHLPMNSFYYSRNQDSDHDLIIQIGIEPQLKWQSYAESIVDLAKAYSVRRLYAFGGLYDRIPHTRKTTISALTNDQSLLTDMERADIEASNYHGPSSIHGLLLNICSEKKIPALSVWGHVPFYIRSESNPIVCLEIVKKMALLLSIDIDFSELNKSAVYLFEMLNKLISENEQMRNFLDLLEDQYDLEGGPSDIEVEGTDQVIKDIENFLKKQRYNG